MQIIKSKSQKNWVTLLFSIILFISGILLIVLNDDIVEVIFVALMVILLFAYGSIRFFQCWKTNDFKSGVVSIMLSFSGGLLLVILYKGLSHISFLPSIVVGVVSLVLGIMRLLIFISCLKNKLKGTVRNGISALLCISFGLLLIINPVKNFELLTIIAGCYLIFYAITSLFDYIAAVSNADLDENRTERRLHFALPNIITALQPSQMIKEINKGRENGDIVGGMLIEQKPDAKYDSVNLEIMVHLTTKGANKFGHIDLAIKDKVYSYGTYDTSKVKLMGFVAQGTFVIIPKIPYLKYCLDVQKKYVIGFGAHLSDKQLKAVQDNIEELLKDCEPFESLYERAIKKGEDGSKYGDPASDIVRDLGGKVYTVVSGPFRRYFGINTNCVKVADSLLANSGIDRLTFNGISTPGGYYSMLEGMFRRNNTRIIRKTSYIISDEIDDLDELRELARQTAAEMKKNKAEPDNKG